MSSTFVLGLFLGMIAALCLNLGKGIQKRHVQVLTKGRKMFGAEHRKEFGGWLLGFLLTSIASLPYSLALKYSGSPSAISAMTGVGLVGLVIYALCVLGERLGLRDGLGIALVVLATSTLGYLGGGREGWDFDVPVLTILGVVVGPVLVLGAGCVAAFRFRAIHGVAFGLASGFMIGLSLFMGDVALVKAGGDFIGQFGNPFPYAAIVIGIGALALTQVGFLRARALVVVPAVNSAAIVTPVFLEGAIYGKFPSLVMIALILVVLTGVVLLSTGAAARVSAGEATTETPG